MERAPLLRLRLLRKGEASWECLWSHPHLLLDGWAVPVVMEELLAIYGGLRRGARPSSGRRGGTGITWRGWGGRSQRRAEVVLARRLRGSGSARGAAGGAGAAQEGTAGSYGERVRELSAATHRRKLERWRPGKSSSR